MDVRYKRARRTCELEQWLEARAIVHEDAVREACAYASTIEELARAPAEDLEWLTEAWEPSVKARFLESVEEERASYDPLSGGTRPDDQSPMVRRLDALVALARSDPTAEDEDWSQMLHLSGHAEPSDDAVARILTSIPPPPSRGDAWDDVGAGSRASSSKRSRSQKTASQKTAARSESHKAPPSRFRVSILTDYAGHVSETVTEKQMPPVEDADAALASVEPLDFRALLNFDKVGRGEPKRCVMCGRTAEAEDRRDLSANCQPQTCVIPKQCKDVCDACTKSTWKHRVSEVYFKWCQGCKKFLAIGAFANKRHTAKCDSCRKRGRQGYHNKVKRGADPPPPPPPGPPPEDTYAFSDELPSVSL